MKKLSKIKLINWHVFFNETLEIDGNTLVSGENGSGKSTLLDAIQYLLVGGKGGVKFNVAATDDAKRTLEGYVRGRIGAENKEHIREGDVITHVALEFFDEKSKNTTVIGVVLDLPQSSSLKERLYILDGVSIHEEMFIDGLLPRDFKSMKEYFKSQNIILDSFDSQKKYREELTRFFGIEAKKYSQLLPKALAFKAMDLQDFVFKFLLDDDPIDIKSLKNDVQQLRKIEAQIKLQREKLEKLDNINNIGSQITENTEQLKINKIIDNLNFLEQREIFLSTQDAEIKQLDLKNNKYIEERKELDKLVNENDILILNLEKAKDNNDLGRTITDVNNNITLKKQELTYLEDERRELLIKLDKEVAYLDLLQGKIDSQFFKSFSTYYKQNKQNLNVDEISDNLIHITNESKSYIIALEHEKKSIQDQIVELSDALQKARSNISKLTRNTKSYPFYVDQLVNSINSELSQKYQKEINFRPFADLLEVNDEVWRNSLEGYLGGQRFDIIGDPKYFDEALEIYEKVKFEKKIYGVGLVNTSKLLSYTDTKADSLASKLDSEHKYARLYANMLLNNVYCVMDSKDLKNFSRSVTPSGMTYGNYTARQMNPKLYEVPFIGQKANDRQLEIASSEYDLFDSQVKQLYNTIDDYDEKLTILNKLQSDSIIQQNKLEVFSKIKQLRKDLTTLEDQLSNLEIDSSLEKIELELKKAKDLRLQYRQDNDKLVSYITTIRNEKAKKLDHIEEIRVKIDQLNIEQKEMTLKNPEILNIAKSEHYQLKQAMSNDYDKLSQKLANSNIKLSNILARQEVEIVNLMRTFNIAYSFDCEPTCEKIFRYEQEANIIRNNNLIKYEQQAIDLRTSAEISFKEEFVNKLRSSIQNAQQQIESLNYALEGKTFGSDQYELIYTQSEDNDYKKYYDIIMSNDTTDSQALFTETLSKKNEAILMELFEKISSDNPEYDKLALQFLDYRHYMSYDIKIKNQNGNISLFSKVSREKSGGETQVPFYIVIAASFQQLLSHNKKFDSGCVVLFDEAFNNMDESRIEAMMRFYNSLSIQLLISVPPQRVSNIIHYVNTSLIIVKEKDRAFVQAFNDTRDI